MYLWRKKAKLDWVEAHEDGLQAYSLGKLVIVRRPACKHLEVEIVCESKSNSSLLLRKFGGRVEILPANWLARFAREQSKPIKIGRRLVIARSLKQAQRYSGCFPQSISHAPARAKPRARRMERTGGATVKPALLVIPASLAFGTGEHATTAMSLHLLERLTRSWKSGWSLADLGTGSGILALAAKRFGARPVVGIDNDPAAVAVAKANARMNQIRGVTFQVRDVRNWSFPQQADVLTANLYSDLLLEILPKLSGKGWLILTGILRSQQNQLIRELQRNHFNIHIIKRRGKWMALMARRESGQCVVP